MSRQARLGLLIGLTVAAIGVLAAVPRISQDPAYHHFADRRSLWGIANALDVLSNAAFTVVGVVGLRFLSRRETPGPALPFVRAADRWAYVVFFVGVTVTGFGSAYYHLAPDNARLVWDRVPMTVGFGAIVAAILAERISVRVGLVALPMLLGAGIGSVLFWQATEARGAGDLRPYVFVQFFPLLLIPLIMLLFPSRYTRGADFLGAAVLYGVAKACEVADARIFGLGGIVSGHTLKHLVAAAAVLVIVRMLRLRGPSELEEMNGARAHATRQ
jgi:hypothetical protein